MKKFLNIFTCFALIVLLSHCDSQSVEPGNHINFDNMQIGQQSKYAGYNSRTPKSDSDTAYSATGDTIVLTVIAKDENGFKISEESLNKKVKTVYYYFQIAGDSLFVKPQPGETALGSALISQKHLSYVLNDNNLPKWTANQWGVIDQSGVLKGFGIVENVKILNTNYNSAIAFYDSTEIIWDGPAYTKLYSKRSGFISFQTTGYFAPNGNIFYLIP